MKEITNFEDRMNDRRSFKLSGGEHIRVPVEMISQLGLRQALANLGFPDELDSSWMLPVEQAGELIGFLPGDFDPQNISSSSPLYKPRAGDFTRDGDVVVADPMLGPGDLEAIPGFARSFIEQGQTHEEIVDDIHAAIDAYNEGSSRPVTELVGTTSQVIGVTTLEQAKRIARARWNPKNQEPLG